MDHYRESNAAFIAPLSAPLIMFFVLLTTGNSVLSSAFSSLLTVLVSYFGFALFILPLHKHLKAKNKENLLALLASGFIGGVIIVSVLYAVLSVVLGARESYDLKAMLIGAGFGCSVAIVFCLLSGTTRLLPSNER